MVTLNKKMQRIKNEIAEKTAQAKAFLADGENKDVGKATALLNEADNLKAEFTAEEKLFRFEQESAAEQSGKELEKKAEKSSAEKFVATIRGMVRKDGTVTPMSEGVAADGGYTVPEDISTKIEKYPIEEFSVEPYITTENVTTNKGARTYEKRGTITPFATVTESGAIPAAATPKFERKTYAIGDRGGMIAVTNDLLADSTANVTAYLTEYLARKRIATINSEFFTAMTAGTATSIADLKGIKKIINVTIGSAYNSMILTNDDGWNWLDCLEDKNGRPLLTPYGELSNINKLGELSIGGSIVRVVAVPNAIWASTETHFPMIIGDTKAAFKRFDRQQMIIRISDVAAIDGFNAWEQNGALMRAVLRDDAKVWDDKAFVYAQGPLSAE